MVHIRLPNGYGSVYKLKPRHYKDKNGNEKVSHRRNPWVARVTEGYKEAPSGVIPVYRAVGYYPTRAAALQGLEEYKLGGSIALDKVTFAEIYEKWSEKKFPDLKHPQQYVYSFRKAHTLHGRLMKDITIPDLQGIIDGCSTYTAMLHLKTLFLQVFEYAYIQGAASADIKERVHYLDIEHGAQKQKAVERIPFSRDEISRLWASESRLILMMIYTGVRIGELLDVRREDVHLADRWFYVRDAKTAAGIREVPIAEKIAPFFEGEGDYLISPHREYKSFLFNQWKPEMRRLNMTHLPHDTRHTCATLLEEAGIDDRIVKSILGHKRSDITGKVYSHIGIEKKLEAINKICVTYL